MHKENSVVLRGREERKEPAPLRTALANDKRLADAYPSVQGDNGDKEDKGDFGETPWLTSHRPLA